MCLNASTVQFDFLPLWPPLKKQAIHAVMSETPSSPQNSSCVRTLTKLPIFCENPCEPIHVGTLCPVKCPTQEQKDDSITRQQ